MIRKKTISINNLRSLYFSDPSIDGGTRFQSCQSSDEIFCQEITNESKSLTTVDIKEQLHYDVWREIEEIYDEILCRTDPKTLCRLRKNDNIDNKTV